MTTCWTWSGDTSARSSAALIAVPPSSVASSEDRPPPSLPTGVRADDRITVLGIDDYSGFGGAINRSSCRAEGPPGRRSALECDLLVGGALPARQAAAGDDAQPVTAGRPDQASAARAEPGPIRGLGPADQ